MINNNLPNNKTEYFPYQKPLQAYDKWTPEADIHLLQLHDNGMTIGDLCIFFGRSQGAINSRLRKINYSRDMNNYHSIKLRTFS